MDSTTERKPEKKPYRAPLLQHYGDLSRITNNVGSTGMIDGGKGKMSRTRP
jgi:hypothetical protein